MFEQDGALCFYFIQSHLPATMRLKLQFASDLTSVSAPLFSLKNVFYVQGK